MMRPAWLAALVWMSPVLAAGTEVSTPQDFAYGMPIIAEGVATAYRVTLTPEVYRGIVRADLGDLRVFNARGEAVAHAIVRRSTPAAGAAAQTLPLFPLRGDPRTATSALKVIVNSGNGAISLQTAPDTAADGPFEQYILDAQALKSAVAALLLTWPDDSADFSSAVRLEASDDFASWRVVANSSPIANLHAAGQALVENRIEVPNIKAKFYRITFVGVKPNFRLSQVSAVAAAGAPLTNWSTEFVKGTADPSGQYVFDLGAQLPVERINLSLPELNSIYMVEFSSRSNEQDAWQPVIRAGFYRLSTADGEQRNSAVSIGNRRNRYWRAHLVGNGARPEPLRLEAMWSPADLEFLAQGPAPFLLAYGSATIKSAAIDANMIPAAATVQAATLGSRANLGGESKLANPSQVWKRSVLWAVLITAVAILGFMAVRLSRDQPGRTR